MYICINSSSQNMSLYFKQTIFLNKQLLINFIDIYTLDIIIFAYKKRFYTFVFLANFSLNLKQ